MILSSKVYDALKWGALILLPAVAVFYAALASIWGFPYSDQVTGTIIALNLFLGAILQLSNMQYRANLSTPNMTPPGPTGMQPKG